MSIKTILVACAATLILSCCGSNSRQAGNYTIVDEPAPVVPSGKVRQLSDLRSEQTLTIGKTQIRSLLTRHSDSLMRVVRLEGGELYRDNRIHLTLTADGGRKILDRDFTKETFRDLMETDFYEHSILEGMLLEKTEGNEIYYSFGVSDPESDVYQPMRVIVSSMGSVRIEKGDLMDDLDEILFNPEQEAE